VMTDDVPSSWTIFRLPRSHHHCFLWNFEWNEVQPASLHERVLAFLHGVQDNKAPHLILTGDPGAGKSHISVGLYRAAGDLCRGSTCRLSVSV
jgi:DNA replication protein DnaC